MIERGPSILAAKHNLRQAGRSLSTRVVVPGREQTVVQSNLQTAGAELGVFDLRLGPPAVVALLSSDLVRTRSMNGNTRAGRDKLKQVHGGQCDKLA